MSDDEHPSGSGRLLMGLTWAVLLFALWQWGVQLTDVRQDMSAPAAGDMGAVGRPPDTELPPAARPLGDALPLRIDIPALGVRAPVMPRGLDRQGAIEPPPFGQAAAVGWYAAGTRPGAAGAALMVGHLDTETRPAVFYKLGSVRPGQSVRVVRDDGKVAEFTVDDVQIQERDHFDARQAYGPHRPGRAELRLITCGGAFDRDSGSYTANVIVSAYLTGTGH
ncbi:class F sortase [Streptomyces sp. NPDC001351]|uniref:class F sortase n=1 Tax=Streptomyces sp. NPDC001351 TaxID=3364564 RepID=UPI0036B9191A